MALAPGRCLVAMLAAVSLNCAPARPLPGVASGISKRAVETEVYEATYDEAWRATLTLFQDLDLLPTFTDKNTGILKAEVPYTDHKVMKKGFVTAVLGIIFLPLALLAIPYWASTDEATMSFTAWIKPLDDQQVSIRLLGVNSKGKAVWKEEDYPILHTTLREILEQQRFLKGTGSEIE